jgi:hypothetical protein
MGLSSSQTSPATLSSMRLRSQTFGTRTPAAGRYARGAGRSWAAVEFFPDWAVDHTAKGPYKVVRGELNSPQYRIKHEVDGHERVVGESELGPR